MRLEITNEKEGYKAMSEHEEEFYNRFLAAYEREEFDLIEENWRTFPGELRKELIYRAFRDNVESFFSKGHFELYKADKGLIQDSKMELAKKFHLDSKQIGNLYWGYKGAKYEREDKEEERIIRNIALYATLRDYESLTQKFSCFTPEVIAQNFNILKCDSKRTESRIKFLLEQGNGQIPADVDLSRDLSMRTEWFNLKYQREIEQKLYLLERGSIAYTAIAEQINLLPDFAYDRFLELGLRAIYGDEKLLKIIDKKRREIAGKKAQVEQEKPNEDIDEHNNSEPNEELNEEPVNVDTSEPDTDSKGYEEEALEVDELFGLDVMPVDEGIRDSYVPSSRVPSKSIPNNREFLDEAKNNQFLAELRRDGIECEGIISTPGGYKAEREEAVKFYVLKVGNHRILEPCGQVGNATYILKEFSTIDELREILASNTRSDLIRNGHAIRVHHSRTEDKSYAYSAQRLKNIVRVVEEFASKREATLSIEDVKKQVTSLISQEETPEASRYVWEISREVTTRIAKFISNIPSQNNNQEGQQIDEEGNGNNARSGAAEEVEF